MLPTVWLKLGFGSPENSDSSCRLLGGKAAPGWFFMICALRLLLLL